MRQLCRLIRLYNVYTEHKILLDLLHSSDMRARISDGIGTGIGDTNTRPIPIVSSDTNTDTGYWYQSQPSVICYFHCFSDYCTSGQTEDATYKT